MSSAQTNIFAIKKLLAFNACIQLRNDEDGDDDDDDDLSIYI